ncbi:hypothetical protein WN944_019293 [Citrus x changshan-huyou]|uniref:Uncharacterized protein n=1 Tax=Citrus x changshan-huyou TaxID=2935761 RepID=A0AAP0QG88_9ROSI
MLGSGWFVSHCAIAIRGHGGRLKFNQWVCDLGVVVRLVLGFSVDCGVRVTMSMPWVLVAFVRVRVMMAE